MAIRPRSSIVAAIEDFDATGIDEPVDLFDAGIRFFGALGYNTSRQLRLRHPSAVGFNNEFLSANDGFDEQKAQLSQWRQVEILFQLTEAEVINQVSLFDKNEVDQSRIESCLFLAVKLSEDDYTRTELAQITSELKRVFPMPCFVLFRYGDCLTLAFTDQSSNSYELKRGTVGKVTLIKGIELASPHDAQVALLNNLGFSQLYQQFRFDSFTGLHHAWLKTLDVSLLNERFYGELFSWYERALHPQSGVYFPSPLNETTRLNSQELEGVDENYRRISLIRLLTRMIFIWFLREKKIVPTLIFDDKITLPRILKSFDAASKKQSSYYQGIIQNLFFITLNTSMNGDTLTGRHFVKSVDKDDSTNQTAYRGKELFDDPIAVLELFKDIPYINSGLFECFDEHGEEGSLYTDGFSCYPKNRATVPNSLFFGEKSSLKRRKVSRNELKEDIIDIGLIRILEKYKFTDSENSSIVEEVAIDPELLGKVFESLLATYTYEGQTSTRKLTGTFYTPREIVDYMVNESLKAYLHQALSPSPNSKLALFIDQLFLDDEIINPIDNDNSYAKKVVDAISQCHVIDPACGSGAFPIGMMHRMVALLNRLDPDNIHWRAAQFRLVDDCIASAQALSTDEEREQAINAAEQHRAFVEASFLEDVETTLTVPYNRNFSSVASRNYARKLFIIENCIFGVDIEQIAVQVVKMRFSIALVAEQRVNNSKENKGILPLPNLETNFIAANTLIPLKQVDTADYARLFNQRKQQLQLLRQQLFHVTGDARMKHLQQHVQDNRKIITSLSSLGYAIVATEQILWSPTDVKHSAGFFDPEFMFGLSAGFDVVIGNPPFLRYEQISIKDRNNLQANYVTYSPYSDLFSYFIEKGIQLQSNVGVLSFLVPNSLLQSHGSKAVRAYVQDSNSLSHIINIENELLFGPSALSMIVLITQKNSVEETIVVNMSYSGRESFAEIVKRNTAYYTPVDFKSTTWSLLSQDELLVKNKIEIGSKTLGQLNAKVRRGLSRFNGAFLISESQKDELISRDANNKKIIKQALQGRDISRYYYEYRNLYVIIIEKNVDLQTEFPSVYEFVAKMGFLLNKDDSNLWNNKGLRAINYVNEFAEEKIIWSDIARTGKFTLAEDEICLTAGSNFLLSPSGINSKYLLCILNSKVIQFYLNNIGTKFNGDVLRWSSNYVKAFPIKVLSASEQRPFITLVDWILWLKRLNKNDNRAQFLEYLLDGLVYELFFPVELAQAGCQLMNLMPALPKQMEQYSEIEYEINEFYRKVESTDHPVRKALFFMDTIEEVAIIEGKRK